MNPVRRGGARRGAGRRRIHQTAEERLESNIIWRRITAHEDHNALLDHSYSSTQPENEEKVLYKNYYCPAFVKSRKYLDKNFTADSFGHECTVCNRLWFKKNLSPCLSSYNNIIQRILPNSDPNTVVLCSTCKSSLAKGKIPILSTYNGFHYPDIPTHLPCLDLVSERLIAPRIPFMQIRRLRHCHGQYGTYGQIINVPVDVNIIFLTINP